MARLVFWIGFFALLATGFASLPPNERPQTGDDAALKKFLIKNNRLPYANESASGSDPNSVQPNLRDWTTCEGCKLLVTELRSIIRNPEEVAKVKELLGRVCQMSILSRYKAECLNMVNNLIAVLHEIEPILDDPTAVCQELQYCPSGSRAPVPISKHLALLLGFKVVRALRADPSNDVVCDECIFAVSELRSLIQSAQIQAELKQELHKICRMAGQYETECSALVDQYFDLLIQELVQLLSNGRQVCIDIGFCTSRNAPAGSRASVPMTRLRPIPEAPAGRVQLHRVQTTPNTPRLQTFLFTVKRLQTRQGYNAGCLVCEAAFKTIFDALSQESVATTVSTDLSNFMCSLLPSSMYTSCADFMKIYSRALLQMVVSQYTPPEICSAMGVCKPEDQRRIEQLSPTEKSAAVCEACQILSQYLSFEFQQRDFQQEVINTLKRGCRVLPGDYELQVKCETYIQTYTGYIMENVLAPAVASACTTLKLCEGPHPTPA